MTKMRKYQAVKKLCRKGFVSFCREADLFERLAAGPPCLHLFLTVERVSVRMHGAEAFIAGEWSMLTIGFRQNMVYLIKCLYCNSNLHENLNTMKPHTLVIALVLFPVLLFAALNWGLFSQPGSINFLFYSLEAPLGIIMLVIVVVLSALYMLFIGKAEISSMVQERKSAKALDAARELAMDREKSRIVELEDNVSKKIDSYGEQFSSMHDELRELRLHIDRVEVAVTGLVGRFDEEGVFIVRNTEQEDKERGEREQSA